jgi:hypothetical protein
MAPRNKARQQAGNMKSRQQAKLNSQRAQKAPIQPAPRTGPRRQLPPSTQGQNRVGNSSQPWGERQGSGQRVEPVRVREVGRPQLPPSKTVPENRRLPGMQGPQPASRPQRPGTSRPTPDRRAAAEAKAAEAAKGTRSTSVKIGELAKRGKMGGAKEAAIFAAGDAAINWYGNALRKAVQKERSQRAAESGQRGRYVPGNQQVKFEKPAPTKKPPAQQPARPAAAPSRTPSPAPRMSAPVRRPPAPAPMESKQTGDKAKDMETWRKANPALAKALDERLAKKQSAAALRISDKFNTKADIYSPSAKVDGSKLDASKIDQNKVSEYKRRKDRYYS